VRGVRAVNAGKPDAEESKAAFREALFAQPDAGAMAEAREIVMDVYGLLDSQVTHRGNILIDAIATALTRREAAGFARGVEAVCKIADSMSLQWSRTGAQEAAMRIASAGRALLGDKPC
jgi:hypothetical protein